jgi:NTE family protein
MSPGGRSLILAGGGIRVAWQTGVVTALTEAGYRFDHLDGSSGGIFTTAMLMSGQSPQEMGERWRALNVRAFATLLPLRAYLRSPTNWVAFGGSGGIRRTVLPGLGIDLPRIRSVSTPGASFNVADFADKNCVAVPHTEIDEDRLVAGVSLAGVMPAVQQDGRTWTDAVWIKDANLTEAVRRGSSEIWVAWCIGNTPRWGTGALEQYVHMIEMSAVGGLTTELLWIADLNERRRAGEPVASGTETIIVHVIRPALPIPLDPDFITGRIDAETLIAMGYRDAWRYLDQHQPAGVPLDASPTATPARSLGARVVIRAGGRLETAGRASTTIVLEADDLATLLDEPTGQMPAVGALGSDEDGYRMFSSATAQLDGCGQARRLRVSAVLCPAGRRRTLEVDIPLPAGNWRAARSQQWTMRDAGGSVVDEGSGTMSPRQGRRAVLSFEPSGAHNLRDRFRAVRLTRAVLRRLAG